MDKLSLELGERCKRAFTNNAAMVNYAAKGERGLPEESELWAFPVMMLMLFSSNEEQEIGTLMALASHTYNITPKAAYSSAMT